MSRLAINMVGRKTLECRNMTDLLPGTPNACVADSWLALVDVGNFFMNSGMKSQCSSGREITVQHESCAGLTNDGFNAFNSNAEEKKQKIV